MLNQLDESKYPLFVSFLKENNIYDSYKKYASNISDCHIPNLVISGAFLFVATKEGGEFWLNINDKWIEHYKQFKNESI